jgi:hypothetical protein
LDSLAFKELIGFPDSPCLMTHLGDDFTQLYQRPNDLSWNAYPGGLPHEIQEWLFMCDLWWTFVTLFRSILDLACTLNDARAKRPAPWYIAPGQSKDLKWSEPRYLIFRGENGRITIRVPTWVTRVSLAELNVGERHSARAMGDLPTFGNSLASKD